MAYPASVDVLVDPAPGGVIRSTDVSNVNAALRDMRTQVDLLADIGLVIALSGD